MYNYTASSPSYTTTPGVYTALSGYFCSSYEKPMSATGNGSAAGCISVCATFYSNVNTPLLPNTSFLFAYR